VAVFLIVAFLQIAGKAQRGLDVFGLGAFVTTSQQNNQLTSLLFEIHPITGALVDPQLRNAFTHRLYIPRISRCQALDSCEHSRPCLNIA
jgi:hypothetical protein